MPEPHTSLPGRHFRLGPSGDAAPGAIAPPPATAGPADGAVTISATEMVRLTGVGRERLRTWERRHDFPKPIRAANNVRRYLAEDVRRVIAVSRAVDEGIPLAEAIEQAIATCSGSDELNSLGQVLDQCPTPALAVAGPDPLRVLWTNGITRSAPEAPISGDTLEFASAVVRQTMRRLLIGEGPDSAILRCQDWVASFPSDCRALAWRLPHAVSEEPAVVLMQLPDGPVTPSAIGDTPAAGRSSAVEQTAIWGAAVGCARKVLQREAGLAGVQLALAELLRGTGGVDAMVATLRGSTMRTARSVHGTVPPQSVEIMPDGEIARAIADAEVDWVGHSARSRFGIPARAQAIVVPVIAGGDAYGAIFLIFNDELPLADLTRELLQSIGLEVALVLARERAAAQ